MRKLLLTGGRGDIGSAIKKLFIERHYQVVAPSSHELNLENLDSITEFVQQQNHTFDAFIHCAGFNKPKPFNDISREDFSKTFAINALAFYELVNTLIKQDKLVKGSYILGISSIYGIISRQKRFSYTAAKHALNGMIKTLALELGPQGIIANALAPGFVDTKMTRQNNDPDTIAGFEAKIPLGHMAKPEDIAKIAYFLSSIENQYINGQIIIADGGYTIGGFEK